MCQCITIQCIVIFIFSCGNNKFDNVPDVGCKESIGVVAIIL